MFSLEIKCNLTITDIVMKTDDLRTALSLLKKGEALTLCNIPKGARLLSSKEDIMNQMLFSDEVVIRYSQEGPA